MSLVLVPIAIMESSSEISTLVISPFVVSVHFCCNGLSEWLIFFSVHPLSINFCLLSDFTQAGEPSRSQAVVHLARFYLDHCVPFNQYKDSI